MPENNSEVYSFPQETLETGGISSTVPLSIYHAPFSLMHIQRQETLDSIPIDFGNTAPYFIPETKEVGNEMAMIEFNRNLEKLTEEKKEVIKNEFEKVCHKDRFFGEYFPQTYSKSPEEINGAKVEPGTTYDPLKYITNLLLKRSIENNSRKQEIVLHPDVLYFASNGQKQNLPAVLEYLNNITKTLDQKIFFENMSFTNPHFQKAFEMLESPLEIYDMVKEYSQIGVVADLEHIEKSSNNIEDIMNIPNDRLIIHARENYNRKYPDLYLNCIKYAIPWVIE